jgi:hypothetical protein
MLRVVPASGDAMVWYIYIVWVIFACVNTRVRVQAVEAVNEESAAMLVPALGVPSLECIDLKRLKICPQGLGSISKVGRKGPLLPVSDVVPASTTRRLLTRSVAVI